MLAVKKNKINLKKMGLFFLSFLDFILLNIKYVSNNKNNFIFLTPNLINYEKYFLSQPFNKNNIFINYHSTKYLAFIEKNKIYNIGILFYVITKFFNRNIKLSSKIKNYQKFYIPKIFKYKLENVYFPSYYDLLCMSFILYEKRHYKIIEVQHGSIIDFFPYNQISSFKLVDKVIVNNSRTIEFLKQNLYKKIEVDFEIKKSDTFNKIRLKNSNFEILYCSSIETNGFHKNFKNYISKGKNHLKLKIRVHPREKNKIPQFIHELKSYKNSIEIDYNINWIENIQNNSLIIVTPWSSIAEEAYDLNIYIIIIDEVGKKRYNSIIDNKFCYFSENIEETIKTIQNYHNAT
jgi:hypothetical protein